MLAFDPDAMTMALQDGVLEHVQLERGVFHGQIAHTATPTSRVDWGGYELALLARGDLTREMLTIALPLTGRGDFRVRGACADLGDIAVFPERGELSVTLPAGAQWLSVQVPRSRLEAAGLDGMGTNGQACQLKGALSGGFVQTLAALAPALAPMSAAASSARIGDDEIQLAHDELLAALFGELAGRAGASGGAEALTLCERWRVVRRAEAHIEACGAASVRIDELCVAACVSLSRLERAFREVYGVGPRRFLMLRRLAAVRRELLRGPCEASVTDIATRHGFFHLGRFSCEYRLMYGERPSQTRRPAPA